MFVSECHENLTLNLRKHQFSEFFSRFSNIVEKTVFKTITRAVNERKVNEEVFVWRV